MTFRMKEMMAFILFICCTGSVWYGQKLLHKTGGFMLYYEQEVMTGEQAAAMITEWNNGYSTAAAFGSLADQLIENRRLLRKEKAEVLYVYGEIAQVIPYPLISGAFPGYRQEEGCVISKALAERLYNSREAAGCTIVYEEQTYQVTGVFDSDKLLAAVRGESVKERGVSSFSVQALERPDEAEAVSREFRSRYQLSEPVMTVDTPLYRFGIRMLSAFPLLGFWLGALKICSFGFEGQKRSGRRDLPSAAEPVRGLFPAAVKGAGAAGVLLWIWLYVKIPGHFIPTKWSEFSFWSEKYDIVKENALRLNERGIPHQAGVIRAELYICAGLALLLVGLELLLYFIWRHKDDKKQNSEFTKCHEGKKC